MKRKKLPETLKNRNCSSSVIILSVRDHQLNRFNFLFETFVFATFETRNNIPGLAHNFRIAAAGAIGLTFFV